MERKIRWRLGKRDLVYMGIGVLLYGCFAWLTDFLLLPLTLNVFVRPAMVIPIFMGFVHGPIVGFVAGLGGNALADYLSGAGFWWNWDVSNGLMGFIPGLAVLTTRRYSSNRDLLAASGWAILAIVVGIGFASFTDVLLGETTREAALVNLFLPAVLFNSVVAITLVPILLYNYGRPGEGGVGQWILVVILMSALIPLAFLGLLTAQGYVQGAAQDTGDLITRARLTILATVLFTLVNASLLARRITQPLVRLTMAARTMERGEFPDEEITQLSQSEGTDEISRLNKVFAAMATRVQARERRLKQQVADLRIRIDEAEKAKRVAEITETEYFQRLRETAKKMRERAKHEKD
ncbi:MAG: ECF transporter S component [Anaerolineae bacterium]